jgi:hypothetical protein
VAIDHINREKKIIAFVGELPLKGFFRYNKIEKGLNVGDVIKLRLKKIDEKGAFKGFMVRKIENLSLAGVLKEFKGRIQIIRKKGFGFIDDIFFPAPLLSGKGIENHDNLSGKAIISFNDKKKEWGWKAVSIERSNPK